MDKFIIFVITILMIMCLSLSQKYKHTGDKQNVAKSTSRETLNDISIRNRIKRQSDDVKEPVEPIDFAGEEIPGESDDCLFGMCENITEYPSETIKSLVDESLILQQYFTHHHPSPSDYTKRFRHVEDLCVSSTITTFPQTGINLAGEEKTIVNIKGYEQAVISEMCTKPNKTCNNVGKLPKGYTIICEQKYTETKLIVIDSAPLLLSIDTFKVPSCCVCSFKKK